MEQLYIDLYTPKEQELLLKCNLCPRSCGVNRFSTELGFCKSDAGFGISSICGHKGEEPVISGEKGVCNVFFSRCNMQCLYCQNFQISRNTDSIVGKSLRLEEVVGSICNILEQTENIVGFVSPSHQVLQMMSIIRGLHKAGKHPVIVFNSNGYDRVETLRMLEGTVDVYLPDFKYSDPLLASSYSGSANYPKIAKAAIKEMYRQKGSTLLLDDHKIAQSGIIVRHLVLPGAVDQSIAALKYIAEEISTELHISLMSQYYPTSKVSEHPILGRTIHENEFKAVVDALDHFGFHRGWVQEMESHAEYRPDFRNEQPF
jgi:putative pyruvate formate lyase activating enzyme